VAIAERELDDASLVEAAQDGDDHAFTELFRRHYPAVRRVCARRLGSLHDADEVAQAAFVKAYERIDQCVGDRRFGAWVQVIAYRVAADTRRIQARAVPTGEPVERELPATAGNPCEDALLRDEEADAVRTVLASLPPRQREVIVARDLEGRRPGEIASALGLSLGAVDSLLLRARRRMAVNWQALHSEAGVASTSVASASLAASTVAAGPGRLSRLVSGISDGVRTASVRLASTVGLLPGSSPVAQRLGSAAATGVAVAVPVLGLAALPAPPPRPAPAAVSVRIGLPAAPVAGPAPTVPVAPPATVAPTVPARPPAPAAPAVAAPVTVPPPAGRIQAASPGTVAQTTTAVASVVQGTVGGVTATVGGVLTEVGRLAR
jgi:RNA polymerase sigma-70 factor, ECF subfamily